MLPATRDQFGRGGNAPLDALELADAYALRVRSLRDLIEVYDEQGCSSERSMTGCATTAVFGRSNRSTGSVRPWRGGVTKQGSRLVRWAVIEGTVRYHGGPKLATDWHQIAERRGKHKATVAIARKVLTLVYYGLRDGEIRCLAEAA